MSTAELIEVANRYGSNLEYSRAGGGNASVKEDGVLYIKPSGVPLATLKAEDLVPLRIDVLLDALHSDEEVDGDPVRVAAEKAQVRDTGRRPSVEILFHALLPDTLILHSHPLVANAITCNQDAAKLTAELLGDEAALVPYTDPGVPLARKVYEVVEEYREKTGTTPGIILLENHGIIIAGNTAAEIDERSKKLEDAVNAALAKTEEPETPELDEDALKRVLTNVSPALRGLLGSEDSLAVVTSDSSDLVRSTTASAAGAALAEQGPLIPDQIVYAASYPMVLDLPTEGDVVPAVEAALVDYREKHGRDPIIAVIPGLVALGAGADLAGAKTALGTYVDALRVARDANRLGTVKTMNDAERSFIENWEAEAYRRSMAAGTSSGRLDKKVVVVTGAAQGFGLGIAQELIKQGAQLVLADMNLDGAQAQADVMNAEYGADRVVALPVNVSEESSTKELMVDVCRIFGGVDVFVSNAGVLRAGSVMDQPVADFDLVTAVNYRGYFLCVQAAAPIMAIQNRVRPDMWFDIIEINSKSGLEGSKRNFAYAGSKFGGIGLTQSFALELVEDGIKVNAICPGNFLDGPLWMDPDRGLFVQYLNTGKVPGATTIEEVRAFYEAKVPMNRGCVPADLATAIYYIVDQNYETGQAVPVTGGQNMLN